MVLYTNEHENRKEIIKKELSRSYGLAGSRHKERGGWQRNPEITTLTLGCRVTALLSVPSHCVSVFCHDTPSLGYGQPCRRQGCTRRWDGATQ
jgi:hypothetical protein